MRNLVLYLPLIESPSSRGCKSGVYVWDAGKSVCRYGKTPWRHAGDDIVKWKGQVARGNNKVFNYSGKKLIIDLEGGLRLLSLFLVFYFFTFGIIFLSDTWKPELEYQEQEDGFVHIIREAVNH